MSQAGADMAARTKDRVDELAVAEKHGVDCGERLVAIFFLFFFFLEMNGERELLFLLS